MATMKIKKLILLLAIGLFGGAILATLFLKTDEKQKTCADEARAYFSENERRLHPGGTSLKLNTHFNKKLELCLLRIDRFSSHFESITVHDVRKSVFVASVSRYAKLATTDGGHMIMCTLNNGNKCSNIKEAIADADRLMSE